MDLNVFFQKLPEEESQSVSSDEAASNPWSCNLFVKLRQQACCTLDKHQDVFLIFLHVVIWHHAPST